MATGLWVGCFRFHGLLAAAAAVPPAAGGADARPPARVVLRDGTVWDACRLARAAGVRPGQDAAAARAACPEARLLEWEAAVRPGALDPAWNLLARASSIVEPDADGRPEALAAWPGGPPPLREIRALLAEAASALPDVDLAVGLAEGRLLARACCPEPDPGSGTAETGPHARASAAAAPRPEPCLGMVARGGGARFLADRPLGDLAALGVLRPTLLRRLEDMGVPRCGDLAALSPAVLRARFGREGERLRELCRGRDAAPVRALHPPRTLWARRAHPEGLPPAALPEAAAALARSAARGFAPQEGAGRLILRTPWGEAARPWNRPRRAPDVLARSAAHLARRILAAAAAAGAPREGPCEWLEVTLDELAAMPVVAIPLWGGPPGGAARRDALDDLLVRMPRNLLRRGCGAPARYETLVAFFDPWCARGGPPDAEP